jgi:hypothetical protein
LDYNTQTANFTDMQVVTGASSGAKGTISFQVDATSTTGKLWLSAVTGTFTPGEAITTPVNTPTAGTPAGSAKAGVFFVPRPSGFSQLGPFHITDCDRGFDIHGQYLRGAGFVRDCSTGLYFVSQAIADVTELDVKFFDNGVNVAGAVGGITYP